MKLVRRYSTLDEARQARLALLAEGIGCDLPEESEAAAYPTEPHADGVRLLVSDEDEARARELLGAAALEESLPSAKPRPPERLPWWAVAIVAVGLALFAIRADQRAAHSQRAEVTDYDRNGDGKTDLREESGENGRLLTTYADDNFDGVWDRITVTRDGATISSKWDSDFDGQFDWTGEYRDGVIVSAECRKGGKDPVLVRKLYQKGVAVSALVDQDGDGVFDYQAEYDAFGREVRRIPLH